MIVILPKGSNRIPLTGLLHIFLSCRSSRRHRFGGVAVARAVALGEDVPYITTPDNVHGRDARLAQVRAGDHVIDLGSGDGAS